MREGSRDLGGLESALLRIIARSTPHPRRPTRIPETYLSTTRDSYVCSEAEEALDGRGADSDEDIQVGASTRLAKRKKFDAKQNPS